MPLPKTQNIGAIIKILKKEGKPRKQQVAIALNVAKQAGAKISKKDRQLESLKK